MPGLPSGGSWKEAVIGSEYLTWMADAFEEAGLVVVRYKDWTLRARSSGGYEHGRPLCVMWHHTASSTTPDNDSYYMCYSSDNRPVSNVLIARDGTVWCLAAGATNTNGKGNSMAFSRGSVPTDKMNEYAFGMEIANSGVGEAYPAAQIDAAFTVSNVVNARMGNLPTDVCTHRHYAPDRKIDPATAAAVQGAWQPRSCTSSGTWDVDDVRNECKNRTITPPPPPQEDNVSGSSSLWFGAGRLDVFMVGKKDGHVYHRWYVPPPGKKWDNFEDLGGVLADDVSATGAGTNGSPTRIDLTGKGVDTPPGLWHRWYDNNKWSAWERVSDWPG